jgi:hypothetical protein
VSGSGGIKLWLDDCRPAPTGWTLAITVAEALALLRTGRVTHASLDYHLTGREKGHEVATFIKDEAFAGRLPRLAWTTHTSDSQGAAYMREILADADTFWDERDGQGS